jgi:glutathione peroxidase
MKLYVLHCKVDVNGNNAAPLYKFLKSNKGGLFGDNIKWNFSKFLVDKEGKVIERYAPTTSPLSIEVNPIPANTFISHSTKCLI